jgi:hypothetical protein
MSFEPAWIFWDLILGGAGFVLFTYGRKQQRVPHLVAGLLYMVFPLFVSSAAGLIVGTGMIGAALWLAVRLGW